MTHVRRDGWGLPEPCMEWCRFPSVLPVCEDDGGSHGGSGWPKHGPGQGTQQKRGSTLGLQKCVTIMCSQAKISA